MIPPLLLHPVLHQHLRLLPAMFGAGLAPWELRGLRIIEALRSGDYRLRILSLLHSPDPVEREVGAWAAAVRYLQVNEMDAAERFALTRRSLAGGDPGDGHPLRHAG